jgi:hypothetical protein
MSPALKISWLLPEYHKDTARLLLGASPACSFDLADTLLAFKVVKVVWLKIT